MKIETALKRFLIQLEANGRSVHTIEQYRRHVRLFSRWAREVGHCGDLKKISHETLARFLSSPLARTRRDGRPMKATTTNALRSSIKAFFGYLHRAGYIANNPGSLIRRANCGSPPPRVLSHDEAGRLLATLEKAQGFEARRDHALFHLMLATGIRLGSALALQVEDIDQKNGRIHLRSTKGNRQEVVFLEPGIQKHLREYLKKHEFGSLFTTRGGTGLSPRQVQRRFKMWADRAKVTLPLSPHALRHTFGTRIYRSTRDLAVTQLALRHRSIRSTLVYVQADESHLRRVLHMM